jgi:phage terminase large subunit-like protein
MLSTPTPAQPELRRSLGAKAVRWIQANVVHGEGDMAGEPFILRPDQVEYLWRLYEIDPADGGWWYERAYYEAPKGDGKTMLHAAIALCDAFGPTADRSPNVPVAAAAGEQAKQDGIYSRLRQIVEAEQCPLRPFLLVEVDTITRKDGQPGKIRVLPANGNTTDGGLPTTFIADEVQDWFHSAADAHERNENSTTKRRMGRSVACSTPGARRGDQSVGWRLHDHGAKVASGQVDDPRFLFVCHRATDAEVQHLMSAPTSAKADPVILEAAVRRANVGADERKIQRLLRRFHEMPRHRFCRFHLGVWPTGGGKLWMAMDRFVERRDMTRGIPAPGTEIVAAFDGSYNHDATAVIAQTLDGYWFGARAWRPEPGRVVDRAEVDAYLHELARTYKLRALACDPPGWHEEVEGWRREWGDAVVIDWPTHVITRSSDAVGAMFADVMDGLVSYEGHETGPVLEANVGNAFTKTTRFGDYIVKESDDSENKIDVAVVAYVANDVRKRLAPATPAPASARPPDATVGDEMFRPRERLSL